MPDARNWSWRSRGVTSAVGLVSVTWLLVPALVAVPAQGFVGGGPKSPASIHGTSPTVSLSARESAKPPPADLPFATVGGLELMQPAARVKTFAFHESLASRALTMRPRGHATRADHPRFKPPRDRRGPDYIVMASRGRGTAPTSAVDIPLSARSPILSPVTGRVISVTSYRLYCNKPDVRVIIRPTDRRKNVVLFHLHRLKVRPGDTVVAGETPLGRARVFRGSSAQYDSYIRGDYPHVHIEVGGRRFRPVPGCDARPL